MFDLPAKPDASHGLDRQEAGDICRWKAAVATIMRERVSRRLRAQHGAGLEEKANTLLKTKQ